MVSELMFFSKFEGIAADTERLMLREFGTEPHPRIRSQLDPPLRTRFCARFRQGCSADDISYRTNCATSDVYFDYGVDQCALQLLPLLSYALDTGAKAGTRLRRSVRSYVCVECSSRPEMLLALDILKISSPVTIL